MILIPNQSKQSEVKKAINQSDKMVSLRIVNSTKKLFSGILLLVLATIIVPDFYIHALVHSDEKDPVHCNDTADIQVGQMHEHCCILQFSLPTLHSSISDFHFESLCIDAIVLESPTLIGSIFVPFIPDLRGPPSC